MRAKPTQSDLSRADELRHAAERLLRLMDAEPPLPLPGKIWGALAALRDAAAKMPRDQWEA